MKLPISSSDAINTNCSWGRNSLSLSMTSPQASPNARMKAPPVRTTTNRESSDDHGLHHITSYDLKGDEGNKIRYQRDLSKFNDVHYVCQFPSRLHYELQKVACEHQSIDKVATDLVSKIPNKIERCFPMKEATKKHGTFKLRAVKDVIKKVKKVY